MPRAWLACSALFASLSLLSIGCSCSAGLHHPTHDTGNGGDLDTGVVPDIDTGTTTSNDGGPILDDTGYARSCAADSPDTEGCACTAGDPPRSCWPYTLDPANRGVGLCVDGTQQCVPDAEFARWGPCTGEFAPDVEYCANMLDDNCDGTTDCADPTCAGDPNCNTGCTDGQTRDCYTGPARTLGVGACHAGTQTCSGGVWPTDCPGEQLPQTEDCTGPNDLNCNRLRGCFDLIACASSPSCQEGCDPAMLMPGCVCPMGTGDVGTCPRGDFAITSGTIGGNIQCCPCTTGDCGNPNCCQETVCAGSSWCSGLYCPPLPDSCMGMVNTDCDDFPEDCDEPCCECYGDCSGA